MSYSKASRWKATDNCVEIFVPEGVYPREPIFATSCIFLDEYYVLIDLDEQKKVYIITLAAQPSQRERFNGEKTARRFFHELISNTLRYMIALRNQDIRECVVKEALFFSQTRKEQEKVVRLLSQSEDDTED